MRRDLHRLHILPRSCQEGTWVEAGGPEDVAIVARIAEPSFRVDDVAAGYRSG